MKRTLLLILILATALPVFGYEQTPLVERFTNVSCGPCATINNAWYTATEADLADQGYLNHIVYNMNWPGSYDPMYLLNAADNMTRKSYYGVNSVPWIVVDGARFNITGTTTTDRNNFINLITTTATTGYAPFMIDVEASVFAGGIVDVAVTVTRDPADTTALPASLVLRLGLTENMVVFATPPGSNGETEFPDVSRKMIDDASGTVFNVPAPGGSFSTSFVYVASDEVLAAVDFEDVSVVAFVQNDETLENYQSAKVPAVFADVIHAAFRADATVGAAPFAVAFEDLSSASSGRPITSWEWDFDNDGTVDSTDPDPTWTYAAAGEYSVKLTVGDGADSHTTIREGYINAVGNQADILVVNGIEYATYGAEMEALFAGSAVFGDHEVDVWDLFGDQGYDYLANPDIKHVTAMRHAVPDAVLRLYRTVIWLGNDFGGDLDYYDCDQVIAYLGDGGNFILATRSGLSFLGISLRIYCGITSLSGDETVTELEALNANLTDMPAVGDNSMARYVRLGASSLAEPIFRDINEPTLNAGIKISKENEGTFVYIAGRPYRYDTAASYQNYDYMLDNWMGDLTAVEDGAPDHTERLFSLTQNRPNPFNPTTKIGFSLAEAGAASLVVYDAQGRAVKHLVDGPLPAGSQEITWDGRDDNGRPVGSGVYFYRLETATESQSRRMVLLK